jgi:uncharacterized membrane protein
MLDNSLIKPKPSTDLKDKGVDGAMWAVHGGGFYRPQQVHGGAAMDATAGQSALVLLGELHAPG